jgi:hypothetical protein
MLAISITDRFELEPDFVGRDFCKGDADGPAPEQM